MRQEQTRYRQRRRTRANRQRTISIGSADRGQTTQDFAVGIGIFLLAIAFTFSFLPSIITPFDSSVGGAETAQADRIADLIVHNASTGSDNEINTTAFKNVYAKDDLADELGLRQTNGHVVDQVSVRVEYLGNSTVIGPADDWTGGDAYNDQPAASSARIVTTGTNNCEPACRLVVRVW